MKVKFIRKPDGATFELGEGSQYGLDANIDWWASPAIRTNTDVYSGADGGWIGEQYYGAVQQEISGNVIPNGIKESSKIYQLASDFRSFFRRTERGESYVMVLIDCNENMSARRSGVFIGTIDFKIAPVGELYAKYALTFLTGDPYLYEYTEDNTGEETYTNSIDVYKAPNDAGRAWDSNGRMWDGNGRIWYGQNGSYTISVNTTTTISPVVEINGVVNNPTITNITANSQVSIDIVTAAGDVIIIDEMNSIYTLNGGDITDKVTGALTIAPGDNTFVYSSGSASDTNFVTLKWNNVVG